MDKVRHESHLHDNNLMSFGTKKPFPDYSTQACSGTMHLKF